ncbi:ElaB/YqjD/DUF883 family membrane-anchored ribosome-binding protein [Endobacter medicaginis]|uniref:ElaB/YqjD/DUF883 family membrane-anchored ribosome-binding protein n=1 Tax=Endobacter medicaginis TaxID=1181271 RepID=A0A850NVU7_9PROT|nr:hypothetical protein [Endobacter medicaginis]MBB3174758.1 ElaB/YqjD/DUF883 family membrane-anchored ribosome-binding protein [Endobacter medicaginis]MCX5475818.1 hypothetical protein [Endobacter medicaginis]NVN30107.1 hypothetical protein [Endobacter medicaginis]
MIDDPKGKADEIAAQVSSLREQVEQLLNERVTPAVADAADRAESALNTARDFTSENLATVTEQVHGQPLVALALAAAAGYLIGRVAG